MTDDRDRRTTGTATRTNASSHGDGRPSRNESERPLRTDGERPPQTEAERPPRTETERSPRAEVLHVEPDPESAEVLATFLERFEPEIAVRSVGQASAAREAVEEVDCVITEQQLPDGSGIDLLRSARKRGIRTPFLFHTTRHEPVIEARAFEAGAAAYVRKRSERGQYDRLIGLLRERLEAADDEASAPVRSATTVPSARETHTRTTPLRSEE